jgi:hypothetical protein
MFHVYTVYRCVLCYLTHLLLLYASLSQPLTLFNIQPYNLKSKIPFIVYYEYNVYLYCYIYEVSLDTQQFLTA